MTPEQVSLAILIGTAPGSVMAISEVLKPNKDIGEQIVLYSFPVFWITLLIINLPAYIKGLS